MRFVAAARIVLVLCATLAAVALYVSGDSAGWIVWTVATGLAAVLSIDLFRWVRPLPSALGFIPILAAAGFGVWEWQALGGGSFAAAAGCVHFVLLSQTAAVCSDLMGPQISMSLAGSLILLLVSVKRQPSLLHLPVLLALLAVATAGLIFRAIMIRQQEFQTMTARTQRGHEHGFVPADRRFPARLIYTSLVLTLLATALGLAGYFFFPRINLQPANSRTADGSAEPGGETTPPELEPGRLPPPGQDHGESQERSATRLYGGTRNSGPGGKSGISNFEPDVTLNDIGRIGLDSTVAMHLTREKIDPSKPLPGGTIYLRGKTLSLYEGGQWRNAELQIKAPLEQTDDGQWFRLDLQKNANQVLGLGVWELLTVRLRDWDQFPTLFVPGNAEYLDKNLQAPPWRGLDGTIGVDTLPPAVYRFRCQVTPERLRADDPTPCANPSIAMTGVSIDRTPALLELARRAAGDAKTDQGRALAILHFLRDTGTYTYTLDPPATPHGFGDPVLYFLLAGHRGHCAFFATAYVLLARLNHIPSRLATGFAVDVRPDQREVDVKHSDAHAWAEVWVADRGWITVDPTPAEANEKAVADRERANGGHPVKTATTTPAATPPAAEPPGGGSDPIFNYTDQRQSRLYRAVLNIFDLVLLPLPGLTIRLWHLLGFAVLAVAGWLLWRWFRAPEESGLHALVGARALRPRVAFYRRMLAIMKSRGWVRRPQQTATEFVQMLQRRGDPGAGAVQQLTDAYLLLRFGLAGEAERRTVLKRLKPAVQDNLKRLEILLAVEKAERA
ncbi:MAG: transglutaminase TgpA family protein [Planctomycetota bacterium]